MFCSICLYRVYHLLYDEYSFSTTTNRVLPPKPIASAIDVYLLQISDGRLPRFRFMMCRNSTISPITKTHITIKTIRTAVTGITPTSAASLDVVIIVDTVTFNRRSNSTTRASLRRYRAASRHDGVCCK